MKRKIKKLSLTRETVHDLTGSELGEAVGGATETSCAVTCETILKRCSGCDTCRPCVP